MVVKEEVVSATMCSTKAELSILGYLDIIQDRAASILGNIGCDNITLKNKYNAVWVIIKNRMKIYSKLLWNEKFTVNTFISSNTKITLVIDNVFKNDKGDIVFYSKLEVCPVDLDTHKIRRVQTVGIPFDFKSELPELDYGYTKFEFNNPEIKYQIPVLSQSIDFSNHTNNTEYIRFILNTYSSIELEQKDIKELEIHYLHESKEKDVLTIYKEVWDNEDRFIIKKEDLSVTEIRIRM